MKHVLLGFLERLGYVLVHRDVWDSLQRRLARAEVAADRALPAHGIAAPAGALDAAAHQRALGELHALREQLQQRTEERTRAEIEKQRVQRRVQAQKRYYGRVQAELKLCKEQLARTDTSGRLQTLEDENRKLWRRIDDLEAYLDETRAARRPYYM